MSGKMITRARSLAWHRRFDTVSMRRSLMQRKDWSNIFAKIKRWIGWGVPTNAQQIGRLVMRRVLVSLFFTMGGWWMLLVMGLALLLLQTIGFLIGDFTGTGSAQFARGQLVLAPATQAKETALQQVYETAATAAWQKGLTNAQTNQISEEQVDLPTSVLLSVAKVLDNDNPARAQLYADALRPRYTWTTWPIITTHTRRIERPEPNHRSQYRCLRVTSRQFVTLLTYAHTWDGTLQNTYSSKTEGTLACPPPGDVALWTERPVLQTSRRIYNWTLVWRMLKTVPVATSGPTTYFRDTRTDQQYLGSLIAAQDGALTDPIVQQMAVIVDGYGLLPSFLSTQFSDATGHVLHDVLRYRAVIDACAKAFDLPVALIEGVVAQESGGREHDTRGSVLTSGVGSSGIGALGLMQVEPSTASAMYLNGLYIGNRAISVLSNAVSNLELGSEYLAALYREFGGSIPETLSAYNAGPAAERDALASGQTVAQNPQTVAYVNTILLVWMPSFEALQTAGGEKLTKD